MTRKELENNRQFQITNAAIDYYYKYKDVKEIGIISIFEDVCKWADKTMIDKVCEWLKENTPKYYWYNNVKGTQGVRWFDMVEDLRKAMEE